MNIDFLEFNINGDERGNLIALEQFKDIPFEIKRCYYIFGTKSGVHRGYHAHKKLKQVLICINGSCKIKFDDGKEERIVELNMPNRGIYIKYPVWREMYDFSKDAILLAIVSDFYEEDDYIRDYSEFLNYIRGVK